MPLGKQAAAYTLASSFAMVAAKCRMLLPTPFQFSSPPALSIGSAFMNTTPTFFFGGSFCVSISCGIGGERTEPPRCHNAPVHNGRVPPRCGKNLPCLPGCPAIAPGGLGKPLGFEFPCNLEYKTLLPPFLSVGTFVFPIPCGIGEKNRTTPPKKCAGV